MEMIFAGHCGCCDAYCQVVPYLEQKEFHCRVCNSVIVGTVEVTLKEKKGEKLNA